MATLNEHKEQIKSDNPEGSIYYDNKEDRKKEYPPLEEQLDYIFHHGLEAWKTDIIQPIKEAHPKP